MADEVLLEDLELHSSPSSKADFSARNGSDVDVQSEVNAAVATVVQYRLYKRRYTGLIDL